MKPFFFAVIFSCAALLSTALCYEQPSETSAPPAPALRGGLAVGTTFTLKIKDVMVVKVDSKGRKENTSMQKGVPRFKKGQKIKFTVGPNEELQGPGFSFQFKKSYRERGFAAYDYEIKSNKPVPNGATIYIDSNGKVAEIGFGFIKWNLKNKSAVAVIVAYQAK